MLGQAQTVAQQGVMPNPIAELISGHSIEVMPRTAEKIERFSDLFPQGTRIYIANVEGTPFDDMVATAKRIRAEGFAVMPHFPARLIKDRQTLENWIARMRDEAGVDEALVLAGGVGRPVGDFDNSMQLLESGLFDQYGFTRLHVAGHPEGNRDIDHDGGHAIVDEALQWKQNFSRNTDADMAIVTQFLFDAKPVMEWLHRIRGQGIELPVHLGLAGPAKLQTLLKFAMTCGVGPSISVLKRRALDMTKLLLPYEPTDVTRDLAHELSGYAGANVEQMHFFPLGGIKTCANWIKEQGGHD